MRTIVLCVRGHCWSGGRVWNHILLSWPRLQNLVECLQEHAHPRQKSIDQRVGSGHKTHHSSPYCKLSKPKIFSRTLFQLGCLLDINLAGHIYWRTHTNQFLRGGTADFTDPPLKSEHRVSVPLKSTSEGQTLFILTLFHLHTPTTA